MTGENGPVSSPDLTGTDLTKSGDEMNRTVVHLVRHGEVYNPTGLVYGRLPDYHLSDLGRQMADRVSSYLGDRDIVHLRCSPLERAQETMEPLAAALGLPVTTDGRVIEGGNYLEGLTVNWSGALRRPRNWWLFRNALKPTWGEPYAEIVARMRLALADAATAATGHEAAIVSHQLPIWMARCDATGRRLAHDPRKRQCTLASVTSFRFLDGRVVDVDYTEPAGDLLSGKPGRKFVAGA